MKAFFSIVVIILFVNLTYSQNNRLPIFTGIEIAVTKEKFYDKGEFDVNVIPIVLQAPLSKSLDIKLSTIGNYHFGGENGFSDLGFQLTFPVFFTKKKEKNQNSKGFYIGPLLGLGRNILNDHYTYVGAIEAGYLFPTNKRFTINLGLQYGASYFDYDHRDNQWVNHFGTEVNLGFWF